MGKNGEFLRKNDAIFSSKRIEDWFLSRIINEELKDSLNDGCVGWDSWDYEGEWLCEFVAVLLDHLVVSLRLFLDNFFHVDDTLLQEINELAIASILSIPNYWKMPSLAFVWQLNLKVGFSSNTENAISATFIVWFHWK